MPYPFVLLGIATRVKEATSEDLDFGRLKYFGKFGKGWRAAEINAFVARSRKPVSQEQIPPLIDTYKHTGVNVPDGPKLTIPLEKRRASALSPRWTPGRTKSPQAYSTSSRHGTMVDFTVFIAIASATAWPMPSAENGYSVCISGQGYLLRVR